jgi:Spy/CpxP family protein refolding chaperone
MKHIRFWTVAVSMLALLGFSALSSAGNQGEGGPGRHGRYDQKIIQQLDLDEQQQALLKSSREQMRSQFQQMHGLRQQLKQIVHSDNYDSAAVEKLADELAAAMRSQVVEHSAKMNAFYQSLNQEQRAKLAELEQQRAERRQRYLDKAGN